MPYIKREDRQIFQSEINGLVNFIGCAGDANYVITKVLLDSFEPDCYDDFNKIIGILECCKLEFYRRAVAPYEDKKVLENGDVY